MKRASSPADSLYSASAGGLSVAMKNSNHSHSQPLNDPVSNARLQFTMQQTRNGLGLLLCFRFWQHFIYNCQVSDPSSFPSFIHQLTSWLNNVKIMIFGLSDIQAFVG